VLASCVGRVADRVSSAVSEVSCAGVWVMSVGGPLEPAGEERIRGPVELTGDRENWETRPCLKFYWRGYFLLASGSNPPKY